MQTRLGLCLLALPFTLAAAPIDRHALVSRHDVALTNFDAANPLSVGNGEFCFTVDATGLQTFPEAFEKTTPLGTFSDWGWHTFPNPNGWDIDHFQFKEYTNLLGRPVPYADVPHNQQTPEIKWLRANPHRLHLGQIGFVLKHADGSLAMTNDLTDIRQRLDLWNGEITSHFIFDGEPVDVETICDPLGAPTSVSASSDAIAVRVNSPLVKSGRLAIQIHFPYGTGDTVTADWSHPDAHKTILSQGKSNVAHFERKLDNDRYVVVAKWSSSAVITNTAKHQYEIAFPLPMNRSGDGSSPNSEPIEFQRTGTSRPRPAFRGAMREFVRGNLTPARDQRSAGVPPAGSPSVSLGGATGGETPPEPAAGDGRATIASDLELVCAFSQSEISAAN